jgi:hypothetical protein
MTLRVLWEVSITIFCVDACFGLQYFIQFSGFFVAVKLFFNLLEQNNGRRLFYYSVANLNC